MQKILMIAILFAMLPFQETVGQDFFDRADVFFKNYVSEGKVNYSGVHEDSPMDDLLYDITHYSMSGRSREYKAAFYINAYNLLVIHAIGKNWPVEKVLDIEGIFDQMTFKVAGEELTLNVIENLKLREQYGDARIHFALVCGAVSCPKLPSYAFKPDILNDQLKELTLKALLDQEIISIDMENKTLYVSRIFKWYQTDFGNSEEGILTFISNHALKELPNGLVVKYLKYDWRVNGQ